MSTRPCTRFLILIALFALFAATGFAQAPAPQAAPSTAEFLASLGSAPAPGAESLTPEPTFLSTPCTSSSQCPTGQLCCYPCGIDGCSNVCMTPVKGRCPFFP
jgi:hypothetical protein